MSMKGLNAPVRMWEGDKWTLTHPALREEPEADDTDVNGVWWRSDTNQFEEPENRNRNMDVHKGSLFLVQQHGNFMSIDISDPDYPVQRDVVDVESGLGLRITDDGYAYIGPSYSGSAEDDRLKVVDVSDPDNLGTPSYHQSDIIDGGSHGMALGPDQDWLYITTWGSTPTGVAAVDISGRENPSFEDHVDFDEAHDIAVESTGNYAFISTHETKVASIDISDPTNMSVLDELDYTSEHNGAGARLSEDENYFFFGAGEDPGDFYSIDISDPSNLSEADKVESAKIYRLRVDGDRVYGIHSGSVTGAPDESLHAFDVSDPTNVDYLGGAGAHSNDNNEVELHPRSDHIYAVATGDVHRLSVFRPTYDRKLWVGDFDIRFDAIDVSPDAVFAGDIFGALYAFNPRHGLVEWATDGGGAYQDIEFACGHLYTGDTDNVVRQIDAETGEEIATHSEHDGNVYAVTFATSEGVLVSGGLDGDVIAYDFVDGSVAWTQADVDSSRVEAAHYSHELDAVLVALRGAEEIAALDPSDGSEIWKHTQHSDAARSVTVLDGIVYSSGNDNTAIGYDPGTGPSGTDPGSTKWSHSLHSDNVTRIRAHNNLVMTASEDNNVIAVDISDGSQKWTHSMHSDGVRSLAVAEGIVVSGGRDDKIVAYG